MFILPAEVCYQNAINQVIFINFNFIAHELQIQRRYLAKRASLLDRFQTN